MMYRYGGYPHMGGFGFEWIFMLIFWALIIWAIFAIFRTLSDKHSYWNISDKEDEAMKILKERYAKGEINKEEFEQKKEDLLKK